MKRYEIVKVAEYLKKFKSITAIYRVDDTIIKIEFDKKESLFFDMKKGGSYIFKRDEFQRAKVYNAPFDVVLYKRFSRAKLLEVEVLKNNRVLLLHVDLKSTYKSLKSILQLEFTGRNTNAIILDENGVVLEALRHIDIQTSYRSVKAGEKLKELPPFEIREKELEIEDIKRFLEDNYKLKLEKRLESIKKQKLAGLDKKISKLEKILSDLPNEEDLKEEAEELSQQATLILSNISAIKSYEKEVTLQDWDGNMITIKLPKEARNASEAGNMLFEKAKKLKKKASSVYIERENLEDKIEFLKNLKRVVAKSDDESKINILLPKSKNQKKSKNSQKPYETFFMDGYKIVLGKNQKGNALLLKEAKKRDIWLHLKDIPSTHVIIKTDKQSIPQNVIDFAGKLCVEFSVNKKGNYIVDYTQRRNVKVVEGANVTYTNYKSMHFEE